jgi:hypothetical protein
LRELAEIAGPATAAIINPMPKINPCDDEHGAVTALGAPDRRRRQVPASPRLVPLRSALAKLDPSV